MRSLLAALFVLLPSTLLFALEGRVLLAGTGEPVANAEVTVLGRTGAARTDAEGRFTLKPDPTPPFEILVILPGERYMKPYLVESIPETGLEIRVSPLVEESVTVTAGAAPDIESAPASATTLLSRTDIEVRQPVSLTQALENVPGVNKVSEGQAAAPAIRGLARGRTLILIDGARVTSERRAGPSATYLDPFLLEGIQVARGPGSVAYGSDALGGVILARTRRPVPGSPWGLRFIGAIGAGEPQERVGAEVSKGFAQGGVLFQGHYRDFDDYDSPEGEVFNSGATDQGFLARAEQVVSGGLFSVGWQSDYGRDIDRPRNNSTVTRFYYPIEDSHRFTASYDLGPKLVGLDRMSFSTFLGTYRQMTDQDRFATAPAPRRIERADVAASDYHVRASGEKLLSGARLDFGLDLNGRHGLEAEDVIVSFDPAGNQTSEMVNPTIEDADRNDLGLYLSAEGSIHPVISLAGGARVDRVTTENTGGYFGDRSTSNSAFSGYGTATLGSFQGISFIAQIARGFRDPVLSDRYFRGVTGRGFITGNPDLEPETSTQFDAGVRYTGEAFRGGFYLYHYEIDDLIERYQDGTDLFFFRNRGRARIRGVELELQADFPHEVNLEVGFQRQSGVALDDDAPLDDISPMTFFFQVRKDLGRKAFVQARAAFYAEDDEPGPTEAPMPEWNVFDVSAGYRFDERIEVRFLGRNLFDSSYPVSPDARAVLAPGISGILSILVRL